MHSFIATGFGAHSLKTHLPLLLLDVFFLLQLIDKLVHRPFGAEQVIYRMVGLLWTIQSFSLSQSAYLCTVRGPRANSTQKVKPGPFSYDSDKRQVTGNLQ